MKAAIYTRVSTPGQAINGESLDMQKERLIEYVKAHNWELYKAYEDGGFSGKDTNRPAFQQMIKDAELKKFDVLVVYKIDRLSRSILDFHTTMKFLEKQNISFVSVTQQFDTTNSMGRLMLAILVDFANFEREINVDRAYDTYFSRLKSGLSSGDIPYGYKRENKKIIIVPEEADKVKQIFELASGGLSASKIAREVSFTPDHVKSILSNPFYTGYVCRRRDKYRRRIKGETEWYQGQQEAIISVELFNQASEVRKSKRIMGDRKHVSLFSKLIYCPKCGHNLTFCAKKMHNGNLIYAYECMPIGLDGLHCNQYLREDPLELILIDQLDKIYKIRLPEEKEEDNFQEKIFKLDRKITRAIQLIDNEDVSIEDIRKKLEELKRQKAEILASQIKKPDYGKINEKLKSIKQVYPFATREEKSRLWHMIINRISAKEDILTIEWKDGRIQKIPRPKGPFLSTRGYPPSAPPHKEIL